MKQVTVFLNKSLNHSLKRFFKTADSFTNEASDCVFEWITESLTQTIPSKQLIHLQMKQVTVFLNESLNHWLKRFLQNSWFIYKWSEWLFLKKSLNHSLKRFFKTADSFTNEASDCVFEEIIESFTQTIPSKQLIHLQMKRVTVFLNESLNHSLKRFLQNSWFIYKWSEWLCFWMNHWIIHSNDSSKQLIHLQMKLVTVFLNESLNHSLKRFLQNSWFIYKWSEWLCFWMNHWIIHSNDSSKQLIHLQMKQVTVFLKKSLNHSLKRFLQNSWFIYKWSKWLCFWRNHWIIHSNDSFKTADSFTNEQVTVFLKKSLIIHSTILQNSWFIYKWSKWLCFWRNHWIIHSNDSFKTADSFTNEASDCVFE